MTTIVGLVEDGKVYIGGDSAISHGTHVRVMSNSKVYKRGEVVFGGAGSWRAIQIVAHEMQIPPVIEGQSPREYVMHGVVDCLREALKWNGHTHKDRKPEDFAGQVLVGFRGHLFEIDPEFAVVEYPEKYVAIGSGSKYALGSLASTQGSSLTPEERVLLALDISARFDAFVKPPFEVECI